MDAGVDKIRQNSPFFVYFRRRGQQNWMREQTKFVRPSVRAGIAIVLPVTAGCILRVLSEQAIRSAAFDKKVIKIKKSRTKSVTNRPSLFSI